MSLGLKNSTEIDSNLVFGAGASAHLGIGGHLFIGFNVKEFAIRIVENWKK